MNQTIIIDNFFKQPKEIAQFAKKLDYSEVGKNYPGKRTKCISTINEEFYKSFADMVFFNFPFEVVSYDLNLTFQLVEEKYDIGLVHTDSCEITVIVFLNEKYALEKCGTGIYQQLETFDSGFVLDHQEIDESDKQNVIKHNSKFSKIIDVDNVFNRALIFDGRIPHCANSYDMIDDRFTLVGFFKNIQIKPLKDKNKLNFL
jgi:hypothetical protein